MSEGNKTEKGFIKQMELRIDRSLKTADDVRNHLLFGKAVFFECGLNDPLNLCYDDHEASAAQMLAPVSVVYQQLVQGRKLPQVVVMNHARHPDNLVALYLLMYRSLVMVRETFELVSVADALERMGPPVVPCVNQLLYNIIDTAQRQIPFKEWDLSEEELRDYALKAAASIRAMVTMPDSQAKYETLWASDDGLFIILHCNEPVGNTLYEQGYDAYAVYTENADGSIKWTLARRSEYVPFDILAVCATLTQGEPNPSLKWGGKPTIGGSPQPGSVRPAGGTRQPVEAVVEELKAAYKPSDFGVVVFQIG